MSIKSFPILRTEAGVNTAAPVYANYDTHCTDPDTAKRIPKKFREVLVKYGGGVWTEQSTYSAGTRSATRVDNPCNDSFSYLAIGSEDFRIAQLCCGRDCSDPMPNVLTLPQGQVGVAYNQSRQLLGSGPFAVASITKPAWMTIAVNASTGVVSFTGNPNVAGNNLTVSFYAANCGAAATELEGTEVVVNPFVIIAA